MEFVPDTGDTAWVLMGTALVLFMTPGLAFFYGGMVRSKNVLSMLMQNIFAMGLLAIVWVAVAFSLAFGNAGNGGAREPRPERAPRAESSDTGGVTTMSFDEAFDAELANELGDLGPGGTAGGGSTGGDAGGDRDRRGGRRRHR